MPKWKAWEETINGEVVKFYRVRGSPEGRETQKIFRSDKTNAALTKAKDLLREWDDKERLRRGEEVAPRLPSPKGSRRTFKDVAEEWLETRLDLKRERASIEDYKRALENHILPFVARLGRSDIRFITGGDVERLHDELVSGQFRSTRRGVDAGKPLGLVAQRKLLLLFKKVMRYAKGRSYIPNVPGDTIKIETPSDERATAALAREDRVHQFTTVYSLLRAADRMAASTDKRRSQAWAPGGYRTVAYLAATTGMRISEILGVRMKHLDLAQAKIRVRGGIDRYRQAGLPKNGAAVRTVDLHPGTVIVLRKYLALTGLEGAVAETFLFSRKGRPVLPRTAHQRLWVPLVEEANRYAKDHHDDPRIVSVEAEGTAFHGLRRFVNSAAHGQVEDAALRRFLGHSSDDMTRHYLYQLDQDVVLAELFLPEDLPPPKAAAA